MVCASARRIRRSGFAFRDRKKGEPGQSWRTKRWTPSRLKDRKDG